MCLEEGRQMECGISNGGMGIMEKLGILTDAAKYDVACTSSGSERKGDGKGCLYCIVFRF